jgi:addiction module HigA family antidote
MEELGLRANQFARILGVPANRVSKILRGRTGITADTALRLELWLGTGPELWLNMQMDYELHQAEATVGGHIRATVNPLGS